MVLIWTAEDPFSYDSGYFFPVATSPVGTYQPDTSTAPPDIQAGKHERHIPSTPHQPRALIHRCFWTKHGHEVPNRSERYAGLSVQCQRAGAYPPWSLVVEHVKKIPGNNPVQRRSEVMEYSLRSFFTSHSSGVNMRLLLPHNDCLGVPS